jgi:hypothetical protein
MGSVALSREALARQVAIVGQASATDKSRGLLAVFASGATDEVAEFVREDVVDHGSSVGSTVAHPTYGSAPGNPDHHGPTVPQAHQP